MRSIMTVLGRNLCHESAIHRRSGRVAFSGTTGIVRRGDEFAGRCQIHLRNQQPNHEGISFQKDLKAQINIKSLKTLLLMFGWIDNQNTACQVLFFEDRKPFEE